MTITKIRKAGDAPRYKMLSPHPNLVMSPVKLTLTAGAITDATGLPSALGAEMIATNILRLSWPESMGRNPGNFYYYLVGEGDAKLVIDFNEATIAQGYVDLLITNAFTGLVQGYIACSSANVIKGGLNTVPGPFKLRRSIDERDLHPVRCLLPDMVFTSLTFTVDAARNHALRSGPLQYEVLPGSVAFRAEVRTSFSFLGMLNDAGDVESTAQLMGIGTTSEGNILTQASDGRFEWGFGAYRWDAKAQGGADATLVDGEQVRLMMFGSTTSSAKYHSANESLAEIALAPKNNTTAHPLCSLVKDPVFVPFSVKIDATGEIEAGAQSNIPPGIFLTQSAPSSDIYRWYHGSVPLAGHADTEIKPWITGDFLVVPTPGEFTLDTTVLEAGGDHSVWDASPSMVPTGGDLLFGYVLLSSNSQR